MTVDKLFWHIKKHNKDTNNIHIYENCDIQCTFGSEGGTFQKFWYLHVLTVFVSKPIKIHT